MMLPPEEIAEQQQLLAAHRRTLAIYLRQQAELGGHAYSSPALLNGVDEARRHIARIKALLRGAGVGVDDNPDDEEAALADTRRERPATLPAAAQQPRPISQRTMLVILGVVFVALAALLVRLVLVPNLNLARGAIPQPTAQTFTVLGEAMEPNFASGQVVAIEPVDPAALRRGDVVVVDISGHPFLKRIVGLPGETVSIRDGGVYVNDKLLDEPYTRGATTTCGAGAACDQGRPIKVLPGAVFVLGDNRMNSSDSREFGPVPLSQIKGRVQ